jgi:hypothetical protein
MESKQRKLKTKKPTKKPVLSLKVPVPPSHLTVKDIMLLASITQPRVSQLEKAGILKRDHTGEFPFAQTVKALVLYYKDMNADSANNRLWTARAELAEMKAQDMRKRLLRREAVAYAMKRTAEIVTEEIQKAPEELAPKLDPEKPDTMAKIIRTYCEKILHDMRMNTEAEFGKDFIDWND